MRSFRIKMALSAAVIVLVVASVPFIGLTTAETDNSHGLVIDFGYWDTVWVEMTFSDGMDGYEALEEACHIMDYDVVYLSSGVVYSVDGESNLVDMTWALYRLEDSEWVEVEDPSAIEAADYSILCWARASGADSVMPGTDYSGYTYYGYSTDGVSRTTGETLRIVSLAPSVTETLCSVEGIDYIVGTDLYSNYPDEIVELQDDGTITIIGGYTDPNYEWIVALDPDIVFCDGGTGEHVTMADKLRKSGIDCVVLYDAVDVETVYENIWIAASALGLSENANSVINEMRVTINTLSGIAGNNGMKVFVSLSTDPSPWTAGSSTYMSDLISKMGGTNVFDSQSSSWFMVSKEQIYAKQPEVIIIVYGSTVSTQAEYEAIIESLDSVWKETPAYENGNIFIVCDSAEDLFSRPGPRLAEAAELLAKMLNPDAFTYRDAMDTIPKFIGDDYTDYLRYQGGSS